MNKSLPGSKEASYRLLGLQALVHDNGVILKRGTTRVFLDGENTGELVDFVVERLAGGRAVELGRMQIDVGADRRDALTALVTTLKEHRFLVTVDGDAPSEGREEVFLWNYQTTFAEIVGELAEMKLTVFGVNSIGLALLGNLRGCGFRNITFVDHPALRNLDYFDKRQNLRREISGALSVPPLVFDAWTSQNEQPDGCFVVCCDFGGRPLMREWNEFCVENRVHFYPIVLLDHVAHLGPIVKPGEGPCYECLWARQNSNLADASLVRAGEVEPDSGHRAVGYLQPMARAAADFAAVDLLKTFSRSLSGIRVGRAIEIDLMGPRLTTRDFLKVPDCPVCSQQPATVKGVDPTDVEVPTADAPEVQETEDAVNPTVGSTEAGGDEAAGDDTGMGSTDEPLAQTDKEDAS